MTLHGLGLVGRSVSHIFLKGNEVSLPCYCRSTSHSKCSVHQGIYVVYCTPVSVLYSWVESMFAETITIIQVLINLPQLGANKLIIIQTHPLQCVCQ